MKECAIMDRFGVKKKIRKMSLCKIYERFLTRGKVFELTDVWEI